MYKDNKGNPAVDTQAVLNFVDSEKAAIVVSSFLNSATDSYLGQLGVAEVSLSTLQDTFEPKGFPNTYPMTASMQSQAFVIGNELKKEKVTSVGLIVTDDASSRQGAAHLALVASADGFTITARASVSTSGGGASAAVAEVKASHPKALVVLDDTGAVASVLSARSSLGWKVPVIAGPTATFSSVFSRIGGDLASGITLRFQKKLAAHLGGQIQGSIIPYAQTYDAMNMMANAAVGALGITATDITTFLQNANFEGVLASYTYTSGAHAGISASDQTVVSLNTLSNGLLSPPPKPKKAAKKAAKKAG